MSTKPKKERPLKSPFLLGCPFCGWPPTIERWHGGGPRKRRIACQTETCPVQPSVTGGTSRTAALHWNHRPN